MDHLVYCEEEAKELSRLLDGHKTILIRASDEIPDYFEKVSRGDRIYFMSTARKGAVRASARVKDVLRRSGMTEEDSVELINSYLMELMLTQEQLDKYHGRPNLLLVRIEDVQSLAPFMIKEEIYLVMGDWYSIGKIEDAKANDRPSRSDNIILH